MLGPRRLDARPGAPPARRGARDRAQARGGWGLTAPLRSRLAESREFARPRGTSFACRTGDVRKRRVTSLGPTGGIRRLRWMKLTGYVGENRQQPPQGAPHRPSDRPGQAGATRPGRSCSRAPPRLIGPLSAPPRIARPREARLKEKAHQDQNKLEYRHNMNRLYRHSVALSVMSGHRTRYRLSFFTITGYYCLSANRPDPWQVGGMLCCAPGRSGTGLRARRAGGCAGETAGWGDGVRQSPGST